MALYVQSQNGILCAKSKLNSLKKNPANLVKNSTHTITVNRRACTVSWFCVFLVTNLNLRLFPLLLCLLLASVSPVYGCFSYCTCTVLTILLLSWAYHFFTALWEATNNNLFRLRIQRICKWTPSQSSRRTLRSACSSLWGSSPSANCRMIFCPPLPGSLPQPSWLTWTLSTENPGLLNPWVATLHHNFFVSSFLCYLRL